MYIATIPVFFLCPFVCWVLLWYFSMKLSQLFYSCGEIIHCLHKSKYTRYHGKTDMFEGVITSMQIKKWSPCVVQDIESQPSSCTSTGTIPEKILIPWLLKETKRFHYRLRWNLRKWQLSIHQIKSISPKWGHFVSVLMSWLFASTCHQQ